MSIAARSNPEDRHVLYTDWAGYLKVLDIIGDGNTRATYDQGKLELMVPSEQHEADKSLLGMLVAAWMDELGIDYQMGGSTTFHREDLQQGLEPDECFWIQHLWRSETHTKFDPASDPPPDLAIEVELSTTSVDRLGIYRALGVPEVWRWSARGLRVHSLNADREYELALWSPTFPKLPLHVVEGFVKQAATVITSSILRSFRTMVREKFSGS